MLEEEGIVLARMGPSSHSAHRTDAEPPMVASDRLLWATAVCAMTQHCCLLLRGDRRLARRSTFHKKEHRRFRDVNRKNWDLDTAPSLAWYHWGSRPTPEPAPPL